VPLLLGLGVPEGALQTILVENPRDVLTVSAG
jgi:predicted metal-dependent phosphotriesterase family hydrolase